MEKRGVTEEDQDKSPVKQASEAPAACGDDAASRLAETAAGREKKVEAQ